MKEQQHQIESVKKENEQLKTEIDELRSLLNSFMVNKTIPENK
jgi:cell division protein FtsB